ncbi:MAG: PASTA domain-containing protein [Bacteroidia bacterium]|nr:PASTA domain-containing protein [Bacteroidia bacterium]MDW8235731.1 PASTA domain-containing protein [Bacteroidia bacterium]MDW8417609.1 PASTA domain-containing protein [Bacteroidia bacterium]
MKRLFQYLRSQEAWLWIGGLIVLMLLSYLLFLGGLLSVITRHDEEVALPNLIGHSYSVVKSSLERADLEVEIIDSFYVPDKPPLTVLLHDPPAQTRVKKGRKVYLTVSSHIPPSLPLPRVRDLPYEQAHRLLTETYGFRIEKVLYVQGKEPDLVQGVLFQGKPVRESEPVPKYAYLTLLVSKGLGEKKVPFISVVGLPLPQAVSRLHAVGLRVGEIRYKKVPHLPPGQVYRQYPERVATDSVPEGTAIDLFVNGTPACSLQE